MLDSFSDFIVDFIIDLIPDALSEVFLNGNSTPLNTKKIDKHIEQLKQLEWFSDIYHDEKYHKLFFVNRNVRKYLQNSYRVKKIVKKKQAQERFLYFLSKQMQKY
ncbi:hypothetical protein ACIQXI_04835 [Lysinibacillus sp. NPDC097195]|uniref:hypothetical protein n=1 Tax=Lysinibacillus sp. NPDC097195 TaxID=3364141 RepID=UPI00381F4A6B